MRLSSSAIVVVSQGAVTIGRASHLVGDQPKARVVRPSSRDVLRGTEAVENREGGRDRLSLTSENHRVVEPFPMKKARAAVEALASMRENNTQDLERPAMRSHKGIRGTRRRFDIGLGHR